MNLLLNKKLPLYLYVATWVILALSAIDVPHPDDFKLEHIMTIAFLVLLAVTYKRFPLSNISYLLMFAFTLLHILGAHYTYSEVPYDVWTQKYLGFSLDQFFGFERNMYDRLVHFSFGLLFAYPVRELFMRIADAKGVWSFYLPLDVAMAFSMVYELIEYGIVLWYGAEGVGASYLGSQGDIWDAQKDMFLATLGAFITLVVVMLVNIRLNPNFWQEIKDSLRVKWPKPLGEEKVREWLNGSN